MLKPYICVACEKVIIAKDDVASLIGLFSKIVMAIPKDAELPKNAVAPREWAIFSAWDPEPGDELKEYVLCTQILCPDQTQFMETKNKLNVEPNKRSQVNAQVNAFPIGQLGKYTVRTWIEQNQKSVVGPIDFQIELEMAK
jgi:hypothetical protein